MKRKTCVVCARGGPEWPPEHYNDGVHHHHGLDVGRWRLLRFHGRSGGERRRGGVNVKPVSRVTQGDKSFLEIHGVKENGSKYRMDRHVERFTKFQETGERLLPPPPMYDMDPVIPPYEKFGQEGHLYAVKPPGQDIDQCVFKVGSTTQLLKRLYWYEPGTELMWTIYVPNNLRILEKKWIQAVKRDQRFKLVKGREYFDGPWEEAVKILKLIE